MFKTEFRLASYMKVADVEGRPGVTGGDHELTGNILWCHKLSTQREF